MQILPDFSHFCAICAQLCTNSSKICSKGHCTQDPATNITKMLNHHLLIGEVVKLVKLNVVTNTFVGPSSYVFASPIWSTLFCWILFKNKIGICYGKSLAMCQVEYFHPHCALTSAINYTPSAVNYNYTPSFSNISWGSWTMDMFSNTGYTCGTARVFAEKCTEKLVDSLNLMKNLVKGSMNHKIHHQIWCHPDF